MSKSMSVGEFQQLSQHISENHSVVGSTNPDHKRVKYMDFTMDFRTNDIFCVKLRGFSWQKTFYIMNEHRNNPLSLVDRIKLFLRNEGNELTYDVSEVS